MGLNKYVPGFKEPAGISGRIGAGASNAAIAEVLRGGDLDEIFTAAWQGGLTSGVMGELNINNRIYNAGVASALDVALNGGNLFESIAIDMAFAAWNDVWATGGDNLEGVWDDVADGASWVGSSVVAGAQAVGSGVESIFDGNGNLADDWSFVAEGDGTQWAEGQRGYRPNSERFTYRDYLENPPEYPFSSAELREKTIDALRGNRFRSDVDDPNYPMYRGKDGRRIEHGTLIGYRSGQDQLNSTHYPGGVTFQPGGNGTPPGLGLTGVKFPKKLPDGTLVATHSHLEEFEFSNYDLKWAESHKKPLFMIDPEGDMWGYDPGTPNELYKVTP
ncbi:MAG: hypothetical protein HQ523_13665 [Lentisphaerae bacterium]|nr:hypothetical protein [Lentisphaerota bacterium]